MVDSDSPGTVPAAVRRRAFGDALDEALARAGMSQSDLARALGGVPSKVSDWKRGESEPAPEIVFAVERLLHVTPGSLSRHLGYEPAKTLEERADTFEAVVNADPLLDDLIRGSLIAAYRAAVGVIAARIGRSTR